MTHPKITLSFSPEELKMLLDAIAYLGWETPAPELAGEPRDRANRLHYRLEAAMWDYPSEAQRDPDIAIAELKTELATAFRPLLDAVERLAERLTRWMS